MFNIYNRINTTIKWQSHFVIDISLL